MMHSVNISAKNHFHALYYDFEENAEREHKDLLFNRLKQETTQQKYTDDHLWQCVGTIYEAYDKENRLSHLATVSRAMFEKCT